MTTEARMMAMAKVEMRALVQVSTPNRSATPTTPPTIRGSNDTEPDPGSGSRATVSPRCSRDRPVMIMKPRMIASGTAWMRPVSDAADTPRASAMSGWNSEISLWMMPMTSAAATVTPNDEKRPTRAAASAGIDSTAALSVTIGARRMAASAERPPATAKFTSSIWFGDQPALAATRRFSATAEVARPNSVPEYTNRSTTAHARAMPMSSSRSMPIITSPNSVTFRDGSMGRGCTMAGPQRSTMNAWPAPNSPSVAMRRASCEASRSSASTP
jgi:hypothetical protein